MEVDDEAAAMIEDEAVTVTFAADERTLELMRDALRRMFADTDAYTDDVA